MERSDNRLEEIKERCSLNVHEDIKWLIAEVERLRQEKKQEEPGEWKVEINRRGYGVYCLPAERKITFGEGPVYCETALAKAIAVDLAELLNALQSADKDTLETRITYTRDNSLWKALRSFNAGEGA